MTLPLRPNVCMLVRNRSGLFFLGQRHGEPEVWQLPQGGVDAGMSLEQNVLRELCEELGADENLFSIVKKLIFTHEYEFDRPPDYAKGKWRGQSQTFWLVDFLGSDKDIRLDLYEPEFSDFRWCTAEEVKARSEPKRAPAYSLALAELGF